jgi:hypothetical protein
LEFAKRISKNFNIGPNKSRIAAILYSDQVQRLIDFPEYGTHEEIVDTGDRTKTNKIENATQKTKTIGNTDKKSKKETGMSP